MGLASRVKMTTQWSVPPTTASRPSVWWGTPTSEESVKPVLRTASAVDSRAPTSAMTEAAATVTSKSWERRTAQSAFRRARLVRRTTLRSV